MAPDEERSSASRSALRWIGIGLLVLLVLYAGISVALHILFDAEYVEGKINEALTAETDGVYQVEVDAVRWSLVRRAVRAEQVALRPNPQAVERLQDAGRPPAFEGSADVSELGIEGVHLWPLLWNRELRVNAVTVRQPHVHIAATGRSGGEEEQEETHDPAASVHQRLARSLPEVQVQQVSVDGGIVSLEQSPEHPSPSDTLWGVSTRIRDLAIDSVSARDTSRVLFSEDIRIAFDGYRHVSADSLYALTLGPMRVSTREASMVADSVRLAPTVPDDAFMRRHEYQTDRFVTAARRVDLDGFDIRQLIEEQALHLERAHLDSLVVDAYRDTRLPLEDPEAPAPMPNEAFRTLDRDVRIDTIRVTDGYTAYSERHEGAPEPGIISFEDLSASIYNVTNDPGRMTLETPAVIDARTRVAGAGRLQTTIRLPLLSPHLTFSYEGQLGSMDARAFNTAFVNMAGVRVESGEVDSLWFDADIQEGNATGSVQGIYRDLEIEILDEEFREQGVTGRLKTFAANELVLESENTPDDGELRAGTIDRAHNEDEPFFQFLWLSLRSGLYSLVGL